MRDGWIQPAVGPRLVARLPADAGRAGAVAAALRRRLAGRAAVMTPRVLLATPDFPPMSGGIQQLLAQLVRRAGWDTTVVCCGDEGDAATDGDMPAVVVRTRDAATTARRS